MAKARILTIDDEQAVRRSIRFYLEDSGYEVIEASNGKEGLDRIRHGSPDLVLSDLRMPEMDGLEVLAEVTTEFPELPIIIVSGTGVLGDAIEAVRLGAWDYVLKPIQDMGALEISINRALERANLRRVSIDYRIHLEDEIERRSRALIESESRFRTVVEHLAEGVILTDDKHVMTYVNSKLAQLCGYHVNEMVGQPTYIIGTDDTKDKLDAKIEDRLRGISETYEIQLRRKNGEVFWVEISAGPYPDSEGRIIGSLAIIRDISDRKRAEKERDKLESQLRRSQKLETIGTLAGGVAHDFNNILTPILGYSEMARYYLDDAHPAREGIDQISSAAMRARDLVRQILTFSRQGEEERKPVKIQFIVKEALKLMRSSLPSTIVIQSDLNEQVGDILCDPTQIHQVMMNLCTNAGHAMKSGGGVLEAKLSQFYVDSEFSCLHVNLSEGHYARLTVSDTGCGMDRATTERIFEPFFTTKNAGEGTGLGLSVVHGIVAAHGGGISVYSEPGQGTTFQIYLPCVQTNAPARSESSADIPTGTARILFVDDELPNTIIAKQLLSRLGYSVTTHTSSIEACDDIRQHAYEYDLVMTDQTMPNMTGQDLLGEILKIRRDLPVVLVTGFSETVTARNYREIGFSGYLMKPLVFRELAQVVHNALLKDVVA